MRPTVALLPRCAAALAKLSNITPHTHAAGYRIDHANDEVKEQK